MLQNGEQSESQAPGAKGPGILCADILFCLTKYYILL